MSTREENRVDLILPTYMAEIVLLIRMLELHGSLAKSFSFFELARVYVAVFDILHPPMTVGLVGCPFARVAVAVGVFHGPLAAFPAGDEVPIVRIAGQGDQDSIAVGPATFEGVGSVFAAKIGAVDFIAEVGGVVETAEELEEVDGIRTLAFSFKRSSRAWDADLASFTR